MAARLACVAVLLPSGLGGAQSRAGDVGSRLLQDPAVKAAVAAARALEPQTLDDQIRLCEIPAPPFKEGRRAAAYRQMLADAGLRSVRQDEAGNVIGERPGAAPRPNVVISAHLDTVFPEGTDVRVRREGLVLRGPGVADNCRGLAVLLAIARALDRGGVRTPGTITFVGTVGEEGLGDLRGVKHLFDRSLKGRVDRFVSIDGAGGGITNVAVGSHRYRVTIKGPGGHSYGAFGTPNPIHALGRAIAAVGDFTVPRQPRTTFSVGRIGGGTSVNALPEEAWLEVDMRSSDPAALQALDTRFHQAVEKAVAVESARWGGRGSLSLVTELVSDRPPGSTPPDSPIVRAAVSVSRAVGMPSSLDEGSTDSNYPMSLKIPAVTIDAGGRATGGHSLAETFDSTDAWKGAQRATLLAVALAQPE
jgi:acetylornithine deacetylase/succinyl-diaminopimelate desuccinylase-like protein